MSILNFGEWNIKMFFIRGVKLFLDFWLFRKLSCILGSVLWRGEIELVYELGDVWLLIK